MAHRFCVSKAATDMMCMAVRGCEGYVVRIREGHAEIGAMSEKSMTHSVKGSPVATVEALLSKGLETLNAKLIELAALVLNRHAATIGDIAPLASRISDLKQKYCSKGTQVALGTNAGRPAGGLTIRS